MSRKKKLKNVAKGEISSKISVTAPSTYNMSDYVDFKEGVLKYDPESGDYTMDEIFDIKFLDFIAKNYKSMKVAEDPNVKRNYEVSTGLKADKSVKPVGPGVKPVGPGVGPIVGPGPGVGPIKRPKRP